MTSTTPIREDSKEAADKFRSTKFELQRQALSAYFDLALTEEKIRIERDNLSILRLLTDSAAARARTGGPLQDLLKTQIESQLAQNQVSRPRTRPVPAETYRPPLSGRRQITGFAGPGHFLGLAVSDTYAFGAEAIEHVRFCRFQRAKLRTLLDDFPLMEKRLLEVASHELVAAQEQMLLLGRKTARERLASFLMMRSRQGIPCGHSRQRFKLPMTRSDIADYLGLTIETISRTLTRLRAEKLIDIVSQSELVICDPVALEELAGGMPIQA